jgi:hypothetical protein
VIDTGILMNPLFPRAIVLGIFGGIGLALTPTFTRRGPMILPVYAALLAALALLAARYTVVPYAARAFAIFVAYCVASLALYIATGVLADRDRRRSVEQGRLPAPALTFRLPITGHAWRLGALAGIGFVLSTAVAFLAG